MEDTEEIKQHLKKNKKVVYISMIALVIAGVFLTVVANNNIKDPLYTYDNMASKKTNVENNNDKNAVLGAQTTDGGYNILINKVTVTDNDPSLNTGEAHYSVNITIRNTGEKDLQLSPLLQMHLVTSKNGNYNYDASLNNGQDVSGPLMAGKSVTGNVDFMVSKRDTIKKFSFQLNDVSKKQIYDLNL